MKSYQVHRKLFTTLNSDCDIWELIYEKGGEKKKPDQPKLIAHDQNGNVIEAEEIQIYPFLDKIGELAALGL